MNDKSQPSKPMWLLIGLYAKVVLIVCVFVANTWTWRHSQSCLAQIPSNELAGLGAAKLDAARLDAVELRDYQGKVWSLEEFSDKPILAIVYLGTECPLAKLYSLRIQQLADEYRERNVAFLAVDANLQDSLEEMSAFARRQNLEMPFVKDVGQKLARQLGVTRTPEVVVIDSNREVQYRGRIDDQYGIGYAKKTPEHQELRAAINALLEGQPVPTPEVPAAGCLIGWSKPPLVADVADPSITYCNQISRIFNEHCVRCHRAGQIGPFPLTDYESASGWGDMIVEVITEKRMPPWHASPEHGEFVNDCSLEDSDIQLITEWVKQGAPLGDRQQLPDPPTFIEEWQLPQKPDLVIPVTEKPYKVRATGDVRYQYFVFDPKFSEDRWVSAVEIRPSNYSVVHHILCFIRPKGTDDLGAGKGIDHFLAGYVPGMLPQSLPSGYAKRIPANSELVFQVHYTPIGSPQVDQSQLGLTFADPTAITHEVQTWSAVNTKIKIPAGAADHPEQAWNRQPLGEWEIINFMPHMHLRGKSFRYEAVFPDGSREILLDIPKFDFNWQTAYVLKQPRITSKRMRIFCSATFDNSTGNLSNPNPDSVVTWGDQTWEEMLIGYFDVAIPYTHK